MDIPLTELSKDFSFGQRDAKTASGAPSLGNENINSALHYAEGSMRAQHLLLPALLPADLSNTTVGDDEEQTTLPALTVAETTPMKTTTTVAPKEKPRVEELPTVTVRNSSWTYNAHSPSKVNYRVGFFSLLGVLALLLVIIGICVAQQRQQQPRYRRVVDERTPLFESDYVYDEVRGNDATCND